MNAAVFFVSGLLPDRAMILPEKLSSNGTNSEYSVVDSEQVKPSDITKTVNKKKAPVTLYNFGYAPKKVIEKFQSFCFSYSTLTEAITNLMKRKSLLKYKYNFISSSTTFQMLARPTSHDDTSAIRNALLALHKFTKDGHYKSVADAIEELLLSPKSWTCQKSLISVSTQTPPLTVFERDGGINNNLNYARVTPAEEIALDKIADAVLNKLQDKMLSSSKKSYKARKHKLPTNDDGSPVFSPKRQKTPKTCSASSSPSYQSGSQVLNGNGFSQLVDRLSSLDPDYEPSVAGNIGGTNVGSKRSKRKTKLLHDYSKLMQNDEESGSGEDDEEVELPPDIELLTPLYRLRKNYTPETSLKAKYSRIFLLNPKFFQLGSVQLAPCSLDVVEETETLLQVVSGSV